jgi:putative ABC transport system permease protein
MKIHDNGIAWRVRAFLARCASVIARSRRESELDAELRSHLEALTAENERRGMSPEEARYAARREFGGVEQTKESYRERRGLPLLDTMVRDLRYAFRTLRKNPGFAIVAILILALGIGANTAIFQMLDAVTMRSLPVSNPSEITEIDPASMDNARGSTESWHPVVTNPIWEEIRRRQEAFSSVFAWSPASFNLSERGEARFVPGLEVSGDFFSGLGIQPAVGRLFTDADDQRGCKPGVVLSYAFWQSEYGGDPGAMGRLITLEHQRYEIVGVTPANFTGLEVGSHFDVAVPICSEDAIGGTENSRMNTSVEWWLIVMGRLKPGWTIEKASAELTAISPGIFEASLRPEYPKESVADYLKFKLVARPASGGISFLRESYANSLWMLLVITGLVLLIACANLANLMLARASARERELTVRAALGASRGRLLSQMLAESVLLAAGGAVLGTWLATLLSRAMVRFLATESDAIFLPLQLDWRTLFFATGVAAATCILFTAAPALRGMGVAPSAALKASGRTTTAGRGRFTLRRLLVVAQIAFSLMLLIEALLFTHSFVNLSTAKTGINTQGVLISYVDFSRLNLPAERRTGFKRDLVQKLEKIPGVESAAETTIVPLSSAGWSNAIWMEGSDKAHGTDNYFSSVGPGFFQTVGIHLLAGRDFGASDVAGAPNVAIVNESFARVVLKGGNPVGRHFTREATPHIPEMQFEIVGMVKDSRYRFLREEPKPTIYLPAEQEPRPNAFAEILIRSHLPAATLLSGVKSVVAEVSPDIVATFQVYDTMISDALVKERMMAWLSSFFGLLAILLAAIGLYGVIAYVVAQRTNEVGIRMALGADGRTILKMFMGETTALLAVGCLAGGVLSLAVGRAAEALLFGLKTYDPATFAAAAVLLAVVAMAASYVPARRAMKVDPIVALRYE